MIFRSVVITGKTRGLPTFYYRVHTIDLADKAAWKKLWRGLRLGYTNLKVWVF